MINSINKIANAIIDKDKIPQMPKDRIGEKTTDLLKSGKYCIDVHTHFFDTKCINSSFLISRFAKDILRLRGDNTSEAEEFYEEEAYKKVSVYTDNWNDKLWEVLQEDSSARGGLRTAVLILLRMTRMEQVYGEYIKDASLARYFNFDKENVITTALMMDFRYGWDVKVKKNILEQIAELKELSIDYPVLPFLFCDPRRFNSETGNLYQIFNEAFAKTPSFFGIKMYPSLGYHPFDYRLWPIYEICEEKQIPVLSHCGGHSVSTKYREIDIYDGKEQMKINEKNRKVIGDRLNDPKLWEPVLKKFPKLKLNLAHFGSSGAWSNEAKKADERIRKQNRKETIIGLMKKFENVYADFSYSITHESASENFIEALEKSPLLQKRCMFGSDFWVVYREGDLQENQKKFLDGMNEDLRIAMCIDNPKRYLFGEYSL